MKSELALAQCALDALICILYADVGYEPSDWCIVPHITRSY